jgi:hypothetical protein
MGSSISVSANREARQARAGRVNPSRPVHYLICSEHYGPASTAHTPCSSHTPVRTCRNPPCAMEVLEKVFVSSMSAPASRYASCMPVMADGCATHGGGNKGAGGIDTSAHAVGLSLKGGTSFPSLSACLPCLTVSGYSDRWPRVLSRMLPSHREGTRGAYVIRAFRVLVSTNSKARHARARRGGTPSTCAACSVLRSHRHINKSVVSQ